MSHTMNYTAVPITNAAIRESIDDDVLEENKLLQNFLQGSLSLEERLDSIPQFSYDFSRNKFKNASLEDLQQHWEEGYRETETRTKKGLLTKIYETLASKLEYFVDTEEEVVVEEEPSLRERQEQAKEELEEMTERERESLHELQGVRDSLGSYVRQLEQRYYEDERVYPQLKNFAANLQEQIEQAENGQNGVPLSTKQNYEKQIQEGQKAFNTVVNELEYLDREMTILDNARQKYTKMIHKLDGVIAKKQQKLREARVRSIQTEMDGDLGALVGRADEFLEFDYNLGEIEDLHQQAVDLFDAAFERVDEQVDTTAPERSERDSGEYLNEMYERTRARFQQL